MSENASWGEGFASDPVAMTAAVRRWGELAEGEAVRFFPALRIRAEGPPAELKRRVLRRADEIDSAAGDPADCAQYVKDAEWLRRLVRTQETRGEACDLATMARFAFLTGLHPAYLWPQAECLTYWGATAAWLGELSRRGRAWMPPEVAEYLADALARDGERTVWRDASLAGLAPEALLSELSAAARRRLAGSETLAHWRGGSAATRLLERLFPALRRRARA
jgi:hypothetical protein